MEEGTIQKMFAECRDFLHMASYNPIYVSVAVVILSTIAILVILFANSRRSKSNNTLLLGLCDSGKTLLFSLLVEKKEVMTHTSIKENRGAYVVQAGKKVKNSDIVDLPGHERIRGQYIKKYEESTRAIVFVIDSASFPRQVRDIAEFLYDIIANKAWIKMKPAILIACNKQDLPISKSCSVIKNQLEKEINTLRFTRSAALQRTDELNSPKETLVGKQGKDFQFSHVPSKIDFVECNLKEHNLLNLLDVETWLQKVI